MIQSGLKLSGRLLENINYFYMLFKKLSPLCTMPEFFFALALSLEMGKYVKYVLIAVMI